MRRYYFILLLLSFHVLDCFADRIYILNSPGYNTAHPEIIDAIKANGHTVDVNNTYSLPLGFTTTCIDPVNGYDWLCFFGNNDFSGLSGAIRDFIKAGGKVFYQYEITCCTQSSSSVAKILSGLTGLQITPGSQDYIGYSGGYRGGWVATDISCCASFKGDAYKGLDGLPLANQLRATKVINGASPDVSACPNFGFVFKTADFISNEKKGAITGIGDVNIWYDGDEPFYNGGYTPVNTSVVNYFFPNTSGTCYLLSEGCYEIDKDKLPVIDLGKDTTLCQGQTITLNSDAAPSLLWSTGSTESSIIVTNPGIYWVQASNGKCPVRDSIKILMNKYPIVNLGKDTSICQGLVYNLNGGLASSHLWSNGATDQSITVSTPATYWVESGNGHCMTTDTVHIETQSCEIAIEMPDLFTPDKNGLNDNFVPIEYKGITKASLKIFNRWGGEIFRSDNLLHGWNGFYKGNICSDGIYFWEVQYTTITNESKELKGLLTLFNGE